MVIGRLLGAVVLGVTILSGCLGAPATEEESAGVLGCSLRLSCYAACVPDLRQRAVDDCHRQVDGERQQCIDGCQSAINPAGCAIAQCDALQFQQRFDQCAGHAISLADGLCEENCTECYDDQ